MNRLLTVTIAALFLAQTLALVQAQDENEQTIVDVASGTESPVSYTHLRAHET